MDSALFYTFSTIAQTLAGAIALLGAFVLYRLQVLDADIAQNGSRLAGPYEQTAASELVRSMVRRSAFRDLLAFAAKTPLQGSLYQATDERPLLDAAFEQRDKILARFRTSLLLTVTSIISSVIALGLTPTLVGLPGGPIVALILGVSLFSSCVLTYVLLMTSAFHRTRRSTRALRPTAR